MGYLGFRAGQVGYLGFRAGQVGYLRGVQCFMMKSETDRLLK